MKNKLINFRRRSILVFECITAFIVIIVIGACNKNNSIGGSAKTNLPAGSVMLSTASGDTLNFDVPIIKDSVVVVQFQAMAKEKFTGSHIVSIGIDTNKLSSYIEKYGAANLLPSANSYLYEPDAQLSSDSLNSSPFEINLVNETKLGASTKYVLPISITSVDDSLGAIDTAQSTLYVVINTGKSQFVNKAHWTVAAYSSAFLYPTFPNYSPYNLFDGDTTTIWASDLGVAMPQYVEIDMAQSYTLTGITYYTAYFNSSTGGYPTKVDIQLSPDGQTWTDEGTYTDTDIIPGARTLTFEKTNARYIKCTVLNSLLYSNSLGLELACIGEITAMQATE